MHGRAARDQPHGGGRGAGARRWLLLAAAGALTGGCALAGPTPLVFRHGQVAPGRYLTTVVVTPEGCRGTGQACTTSTKGLVEVVLPRDPETETWVYEAFAHELCHVVAGLQGLVGAADPCHNEDGGRMRNGRHGPGHVTERRR
jgi:hypothetical protein